MKISDLIKKKLISANNYIRTFIRFVVVAGITGIVGGVVGGAFCKVVEIATETRTQHEWLIYLLPVAGLLIIFLYRKMNLKTDPGTNRIISTVRSDGEIPISMAPLIFIGTAVTHLFGGSAGREGAALQLGGSIGFSMGKVFRLDNKNMPLSIMCGMSAVFAALFGTPLTAVFFAMEVISVGVIYYSALVPCLVSSYIAVFISSLFGNSPEKFAVALIPNINFGSVAAVMALGALCAVLSICFCAVMKYSGVYAHKFIKNDYIRIFSGGCIVIVLTLLIGTRDFNGAGMNVIENAINGNAEWYAFIMKIIFTAVTIGFGFKGGEIVPTFFIGATFGCIIGPLFGLPASFSASVGIVALFVGVVNSPIASLVLSIELFGSQGMLFYAAAIFVSYMLSGYYGLYSQQKIIYSKLKAEYININAK
jgi:H+/Cl- antiporter ClcA